MGDTTDEEEFYMLEQKMTLPERYAMMLRAERTNKSRGESKNPSPYIRPLCLLVSFSGVARGRKCFLRRGVTFEIKCRRQGLERMDRRERPKLRPRLNFSY